MNDFSVIGINTPNISGPSIVRGEAKYTVDLISSSMLHGKILRSPYPHARIKSINKIRAEKLKGVKAVAIGRDLPGIPYSLVDIPPKYPANAYPLAVDKVRYIGEEVAAVAAIDDDTAEEALDLIEVEYEELPAVFDPEAAMMPDAPRIHEHSKDNVSWKLNLNTGNVEKGFSQSDYIREDKFKTQLVAHCAMEPHAVVADYKGGFLTVWSSTQSPYFVQIGLAQALKIPVEKIRVIKPHVGGGFGGKHEMMHHEAIAGFLAMKTGRPVKIVLTREEVFTATRYRHPLIMELKIGVKKDGKIMAREGRAIFDGGAYNSVGVVANYLSAIFMNLPYRIPNMRYEAYRVFTNNCVSGAMRGFGSPQIHFASDGQIDAVAADLGLDPFEIRRKNSIKPGERTPNGLKIYSCGFDECLQKAEEVVKLRKDWRSKKKESGNGLGCSGFLSGSGLRFHESHAFSSAIIRAYVDGSVTLFTGASDIGQGSDTVLCQIATEELGIRMENIKLEAADTKTTPLDLGTYSSRVTLMAGNAVKEAASRLKRKLFKEVSRELEADLNDLVARDNKIYVLGSPENGIDFSKAVFLLEKRQKGSPVIEMGKYNPAGDTARLDPIKLTEEGIGDYSPTYSFAAHLAEVKVDRETGIVKVSKILAAHDLGFPINPMAAEGQLEGSVQMGLGFALFEDLQREKGRILNPSFLEYRIPTALDMPEITPVIVRSDDPIGPFGAKECGEGATSPVCPAIVNAVYDAVKVRAQELPLTPEKLLKLLKDSR